MTPLLNRIAVAIAKATGHWAALLLATGVVIAWVVVDRPFDFLDAISAVTFWMLFSLQNAQTRDTVAMQMKLDELLVTLEGPDDDLAGIEKEYDRG